MVRGESDVTALYDKFYHRVPVINAGILLMRRTLLVSVDMLSILLPLAGDEFDSFTTATPQ